MRLGCVQIGFYSTHSGTGLKIRHSLLLAFCGQKHTTDTNSFNHVGQQSSALQEVSALCTLVLTCAASSCTCSPCLQWKCDLFDVRCAHKCHLAKPQHSYAVKVLYHQALQKCSDSSGHYVSVLPQQASVRRLEDCLLSMPRRLCAH